MHLIRLALRATALCLALTSCKTTQPVEKPDVPDTAAPQARLTEAQLRALITRDALEAHGPLIATHFFDLDGQAPDELVLLVRCNDHASCEKLGYEEEVFDPARLEVYDVSDPEAPLRLFLKPRVVSARARLQTGDLDGDGTPDLLVTSPLLHFQQVQGLARMGNTMGFFHHGSDHTDFSVLLVELDDTHPAELLVWPTSSPRPDGALPFAVRRLSRRYGYDMLDITPGADALNASFIAAHATQQSPLHLAQHLVAMRAASLAPDAATLQKVTPLLQARADQLITELEGALRDIPPPETAPNMLIMPSSYSKDGSLLSHTTHELVFLLNALGLGDDPGIGAWAAAHAERILPYGAFTALLDLAWRRGDAHVHAALVTRINAEMDALIKAPADALQYGLDMTGSTYTGDGPSRLPLSGRYVPLTLLTSSLIHDHAKVARATFVDQALRLEQEQPALLRMILDDPHPMTVALVLAPHIHRFTRRETLDFLLVYPFYALNSKATTPAQRQAFVEALTPQLTQLTATDATAPLLVLRVAIEEGLATPDQATILALMSAGQRRIASLKPITPIDLRDAIDLFPHVATMMPASEQRAWLDLILRHDPALLDARLQAPCYAKQTGEPVVAPWRYFDVVLTALERSRAILAGSFTSCFDMDPSTLTEAQRARLVPIITRHLNTPLPAGQFEGDRLMRVAMQHSSPKLTAAYKRLIKRDIAPNMRTLARIALVNAAEPGASDALLRDVTTACAGAAQLTTYPEACLDTLRSALTVKPEPAFERVLTELRTSGMCPSFMESWHEPLGPEREQRLADTCNP